MFNGIKRSAANTARRAGLLSAGVVLLIVGAAFLTSAAWIYLSIVLGSQQAALIIGLVYAGIGLVFVGLGLRGGEQPSVAAPPDQSVPAGPPMMQAFLYGLQAGVAADTRKG